MLSVMQKDIGNSLFIYLHFVPDDLLLVLVSSQVIVARTLSKKQMLMSVCTKIGIQLNCKLGGEVWAVDIPLKNLMVIGIDCYHDSVSKGKSISGFVASTNQTLTK